MPFQIRKILDAGILDAQCGRVIGNRNHAIYPVTCQPKEKSGFPPLADTLTMPRVDDNGYTRKTCRHGAIEVRVDVVGMHNIKAAVREKIFQTLDHVPAVHGPQRFYQRAGVANLIGESALISQGNESHVASAAVRVGGQPS
jgi:hypothetical protein